MKFSEALRLGAMQVPAARGVLIRTDAKRQPIAACAIGTALVAAGFPQCGKRANVLFPILDLEVKAPSHGWWFPDLFWGRSTSSVFHHVVCLFESRKWSREQIADWVESVERAQEPREALQALSLVGVGIEQ